MSEEAITPEAVAHLKALKGLKRIIIDYAWIPNDAVRQLQQALPDCEIGPGGHDLEGPVRLRPGSQIINITEGPLDPKTP